MSSSRGRRSIVFITQTFIGSHRRPAGATRSTVDIRRMSPAAAAAAARLVVGPSITSRPSVVCCRSLGRYVRRIYVLQWRSRCRAKYVALPNNSQYEICGEKWELLNLTLTIRNK